MTMPDSGQSSAAEKAEALFQVGAVEASNSATPESFHLPASIWPRLLPKFRLYCEALILMVLLQKAESDRGYEDLLVSYERIIFPEAPTNDGIARLEELKLAMKDIAALVEQEKPFSWSRNWLGGIGHEEHNPVVLEIFALYWMDAYIAAHKSITEVQSI